MCREKHEFALFVESLSLLIQQIKLGERVVFDNENLFHRMTNVLRLRAGQSCIFFDRNIFIKGKIEAFLGKKHAAIIIQSKHQTIILHPRVTFLLPILKRDDYEAALYTLAEVGVNVIQLIFTQKTGNQWTENRDRERAQRILVSAAEQSKNFAYPELKSPISLEEVLNKYEELNAIKIFFDPEGGRFFDVMNMLYHNQSDHIILLVGPEGDLNPEEKVMVQAKGFIFCSLTPTILRAVQAVALATGFIRSLLR